MNEKSISTRNPQALDKSQPNPANCTITTAGERCLAACGRTKSALQQLRDLLISCQICPAVDKCDLSEHFNLQVDQSLAEINDDWGW
jgi:hypothetical protein